MTEYAGARSAAHFSVEADELSRFMARSGELSSQLARLEARLEITEHQALTAMEFRASSVERNALRMGLADMVRPSDELVTGLIHSLLDTAADTAIDQAWNVAENIDRFGSIEADLIANTLTPIFGPSFSSVAGERLANAQVRLFNEVLIPASAEAATRLFDPFVSISTNGDSGGRFNERITEMSFASDQGRDAILAGLLDISRDDLIRDDEFQLIHHGGSRYTAVLPGVIDLARPDSGLHSVHTSVRDMSAATRSASSADIEDNLYALAVARYLEANVPNGSSVAIIGHSFGADTALDLAADPTFNGRHVSVTHVVAAGYHSGPQLAAVEPHTEVLVLQNERDLPILIENLGHLEPTALEPNNRGDADRRQLIHRFEGGWSGFGHDPSHYVNYLSLAEHDNNRQTSRFFDAWAEAGYASGGTKTSIDISYEQ